MIDFKRKPILKCAPLPTRTENRSINYMKPERIYKVRIVRASYVNEYNENSKQYQNEMPNEQKAAEREGKRASEKTHTIAGMEKMPK